VKTKLVRSGRKSCRSSCWCKAPSAAFESAIALRLAVNFGGNTLSFPPYRWSVPFTSVVCRENETSAHVSARSSPSRMPMQNASVNGGSQRSPVETWNSWLRPRRSIGDGRRGLTWTGLTARATFPSSKPSRSASDSTLRSTACAYWTVLAEQPWRRFRLRKTCTSVALSSVSRRPPRSAAIYRRTMIPYPSTVLGRSVGPMISSSQYSRLASSLESRDSRLE
jgi:hypothetical protein